MLLQAIRSKIYLTGLQKRLSPDEQTRLSVFLETMLLVLAHHALSEAGEHEFVSKHPQ